MAKAGSEWIVYASQVIDFLWLTMRLVCVVVVKPGACMHSSSGSNDYLQMLKVYHRYISQRKTFVRLQSMLVISMGNDLYRLPGYGVLWQVKEAAVWLAAHLKDRNVPRTVMVYGGSAGVWQWYARENPKAKGYDHAADQVRRVMKYAGFPVISGEEELLGIAIADDIGHISKRSISQALRAVYSWLRDPSRL